MKLVILVGVPGSGKSALLAQLVHQLPEVKVLNYGDKMLEEASSKGLSRDMIRRMEYHEQRRLGLMAARRIAGEAAGHLTVVDTHSVIRTPLGYRPGLPHDVLEVLSPQALAYIACSPKTIQQRRSLDTSRHRDVESLEELALDLEMTRAYLAAASVLTGASLSPIPNDSGSIQDNAAPLVRLLQSL